MLLHFAEPVAALIFPSFLPSTCSIKCLPFLSATCLLTLFLLVPLLLLHLHLLARPSTHLFILPSSSSFSSSFFTSFGALLIPLVHHKLTFVSLPSQRSSSLIWLFWSFSQVKPCADQVFFFALSIFLENLFFLSYAFFAFLNSTGIFWLYDTRLQPRLLKK